MALACCSLSLLIQVHEAAAVVASGGDAGDEWRPAAASTRAAARRRGASVLAVCLWHAVERCLTPPCEGYSLSKSIYDLRTTTRALIRVRRASLGPQGRVPPGVHGEAR